MMDECRKSTVKLNNLRMKLHRDEACFLVTNCQGCGIKTPANGLDTPVISADLRGTMGMRSRYIECLLEVRHDVLQYSMRNVRLMFPSVAG
jgi:hypothetical protein